MSGLDFIGTSRVVIRRTPDGDIGIWLLRRADDGDEPETIILDRDEWCDLRLLVAGIDAARGILA